MGSKVKRLFWGDGEQERGCLGKGSSKEFARDSIPVRNNGGPGSPSVSAMVRSGNKRLTPWDDPVEGS
jgi:hypothetical protein